ncbi:hypothetical protein EJB05_20793, partial [Eragrostis curvula]
MFEGHIPASLGNALGLEVIDLTNNNFIGQIPSSFGKLSRLYSLLLEGNMLEARDSEGWEFFHALVNCSLLKELSLANNNLQGPIPNSIANLTTNLAYLLMDGNQLSGIVPPSIGKFNDLTEQSELRLDFNNLNENKFTSFVPPGLGKLQHILKLNLSYNNFQGSIPVELGPIPAFISYLGSLTTLDLSYIGFQGELPTAGIFADALAYLHHDCESPIVRCDLKPTNILLDDDMNAHLGDFGIATLVLDSRSKAVGHSGPHSSVSVMGTIGYIAPEYAHRVHASTCGDVYSFGMPTLGRPSGQSQRAPGA